MKNKFFLFYFHKNNLVVKISLLSIMLMAIFNLESCTDSIKDKITGIYIIEKFINISSEKDIYLGVFNHSNIIIFKKNKTCDIPWIERPCGSCTWDIVKRDSLKLEIRCENKTELAGVYNLTMVQTKLKKSIVLENGRWKIVCGKM